MAVNSNNNEMRILILGANGQIGRAVFTWLSRAFPEAEVLGGVRAPHFHFDGVGANRKHRSIVVDLLSAQPKLPASINVVINCIGAHEGSPQQLARVHVGVTHELLHHRVALGNPAIIQLSALVADGAAATAFESSKFRAEADLLAANRTWVIRASLVCSPETRLVKKLRQLRRVAWWFGGRLPIAEQVLRARLQSVSANDVAALVEAVIRKRPADRLIEATGADILTFGDLLGLAGVRTVAVPKMCFAALKRLLRLLQKNALPEHELLMGSDNKAGNTRMAELLERAPERTRQFWQEQLHPSYCPRVDFSTVFA